jgi:DNA-3-methyladenine glycosylase II
VAALQRVPTNPVEARSHDDRYMRAFATPSGPLIWEVTEGPRRASLALRLHGPIGDVAPWASLVRRILGCDVDLAGCYEVASGIPVLAQLADRFRGLKPPRFASLWESLVNAIAFQQLSLASGMAAVARLTRRCARPGAFRGAALYPFPPPEAVKRLSDAELRACGFSGAKARSLRAAAAAVLDGAVREDELERLGDEQAMAQLRELPGVGPWTASLILLRGLRRLTSFPAETQGPSGGCAPPSATWTGRSCSPASDRGRGCSTTTSSSPPASGWTVLTPAAGTHFRCVTIRRKTGAARRMGRAVFLEAVP